MDEKYYEVDGKRIKLQDILDLINYDDFQETLNTLVGRVYNDPSNPKKKLKVKAEDIQEINKAYKEIYDEIASGNNRLLASNSGGFNNIDGSYTDRWSNAYRIATGLIAPKIRTFVRNYKDPSKIEYTDDALGDFIKKDLFGKYGTIKDFQNLDYNKETDKIESNSKRIENMLASMNRYKAKLEDLNSEYSDWTDEQRNTALSNLEDLFTVFSTDNNITKDEYLKAKKYFGKYGDNFIKALTLNEYETPETPDTTPEQNPRNLNSFIRWLTQAHPYTVVDQNPILLGDIDTSNMLYDKRTNLKNYIKTLSVEQLSKVLEEAMKNNDYAFNNNELFKVFPGLTREYTKYIYPLIFNALKDKNWNGFVDLGNNLYHIKNASHSNYPETGFVWNAANNQIRMMSFHDMPYKQQEYLNEYLGFDDENLDQNLLRIYGNLISSHKNGGSIRKFEPGGGVEPKINKTTASNNRLVDGFTWQTSFYDQKLEDDLIQKFEDIYNDVTLSDEGKRQAYQKLIDQLNTLQTRHYKIFGDDYDTKLSYNSDLVKEHQQDVLDNFGFLNDTISRASKNNQYIIVNSNTTGTDSATDDFSKTDTFGQAYTWSRWLGDKDMNLGMWNRLKKYNVRQTTSENTGKHSLFELFNPESENTTQTNDDSNKTDQPNGQQKGTILDETSTHTAPVKQSFFDKTITALQQVAPDILDNLRYTLSKKANKNVENALLRSPHLLQTSEKYHRITYDLARLQLSNERAADAMRIAGQPGTSDAELAARKLFEAHRIGTDYKTQGHIAVNDKLEQRIDKVENDANENAITSSNTHNKQLAIFDEFNKWNSQVRAQKFKSDYNSDNSYLSGIINTMRYNWLENEPYREAANKSYVYANYQPELDQIEDLQTKWQSKHSGEDMSSASWYNTVVARQKEIANRISNESNLLNGRLKGLSYYDFYKNNPYTSKDWNSIII